MKAVLQRVSSARVVVAGEAVGQIGAGWLVLLGVAGGDTESDADWLAQKTVELRAFADDDGKFNRSVIDAGGGVLVASQFTLLGDCRKGRRPSFTDAAAPDVAERLYDHYAAQVAKAGVLVAKGVFRAHMDVHLCNDGPVTLLLDSRKSF